MKMVDTRKHPDATASVKKEVCIQKFLQHPHILRYFGTRRQNDIEYIFLEYAAGGELFDRIGMYIIYERIGTSELELDNCFLTKCKCRTGCRNAS